MISTGLTEEVYRYFLPASVLYCCMACQAIQHSLCISQLTIIIDQPCGILTYLLATNMPEVVCGQYCDAGVLCCVQYPCLNVFTHRESGTEDLSSNVLCNVTSTTVFARRANTYWGH